MPLQNIFLLYNKGKNIFYKNIWKNQILLLISLKKIKQIMRKYLFNILWS